MNVLYLIKIWNFHFKHFLCCAYLTKYKQKYLQKSFTGWLSLKCSSKDGKFNITYVNISTYTDLCMQGAVTLYVPEINKA
jgi:hypothetical protein